MGEVKEVLENIFKEVLNTDEFNMDMSMDNTDNWDSLAQLMIIGKIEEAFDVEFPFDEATELTSAKKFYEAINRELKDKGTDDGE